MLFVQTVPSEIDAATAFRFVLYHVMRDAALEAIFQVRALAVGHPPPH